MNVMICVDYVHFSQYT